MLGAAVLNYSTPTLLNWGQKFDEWWLVANGSHLGKISGLRKYLEQFGEGADEDLVLVIDGLDTWFQLGPDVLISRYHAVNQQANRRISQRLCGRESCPFPPFSHVRQDIIFSATKRCWPAVPDELPCYASPPSPLPEDLYGPETDLPFADMENPYARTRSRYLNSGFTMGTVKAMRKFFTEAEKVMKISPHQGSDQGVVSEIFGRQEYAREVLRQQYLSRHPTQRLLRRLANLWYGKTPSDRDRDAVLEPHPTRERPLIDLANASSTEAMEYGVGLDYANDFSHTTVHSVRDADWINFSNPETPSRNWHTVSPRIKSLPADLADRPPLPILNMTWDQVPLYTHMWTGNVPVSIHHNEYVRNSKNLRRSQWGQLWWNRDAKALLDAHIQGPMQPVAVEWDHHQRHGAAATEWWSPSPVKGGAMADTGMWIEWRDLCGEFEDTLFAPGVGTS